MKLARVTGVNLEDEEKLKEIRRIEKIASERIEREEEKMRDWQGKIHFKDQGFSEEGSDKSMSGGSSFS